MTNEELESALLSMMRAEVKDPPTVGASCELSAWEAYVELKRETSSTKMVAALARVMVGGCARGRWIL